MSKFKFGLMCALAIASVQMVFGGYDRYYTWCGAGEPNPDGSYNWDDTANWLWNNQPLADGSSPGFASKGVLAAADEYGRAQFPKDCTVKIVIPMSCYIHSVNLGNVNQHITLTAKDGDKENILVELQIGTATLNTPSELIFEDISIKRKGDLQVNKNSTVVLRNAKMTTGNPSNMYNEGGTLVIEDSVFDSTSQLRLGGGLVILRNGTLKANFNGYFGFSNPNGKIRIEGKNSLLYVKDSNFYSSTLGCTPTLEFCIPAAGYASAPVQAANAGNKFLGRVASGETGRYKINIDPESPVFKLGLAEPVPLIAWPKGVTKDYTTYNATEVENVEFFEAAAYDGYEGSWAEFNTLENPQAIGVKIEGAGGQIEIVGDPANYGTVEYGVVEGLHEGDERTFTASASTNASQTIVYTPIRWSLAAFNADSGSYITYLEGDEGVTTCDYVHPSTPVTRLTWHWQVSNKITAEAGEGGTTDAPYKWGVSDGTVTFTAIPDEGYSLRRWVDEQGKEIGTEATLTVAADAVKTVKAVFGRSLYLAMDGNDETAKPADEGHPYGTFAACLAQCGANDTLVIKKGEYAMGAEAVLDKALMVRGATGNPADVILRMTSGIKQRLFTLAHSEAMLIALTLADGHPSSGDGGCVYFSTGGTMRNCILTGGQPTGYNAAGGGFAIAGAASGALVENCIVSNCDCSASASSGEGGGGIAAQICAGEVRNCLFTKNVSTSGQHFGGTVYIYQGGSGARVVSCTIAGNSAKYASGARTHQNYSAGTFINCLIGDNKSEIARSGGNLGEVWAGNASNFDNCMATELINGFCKTGTAIFRDAGSGDYRPGASAIDMGRTEAWMTGVNAVDLAGNPRISGEKPDIGCYEYVKGAVYAEIRPRKTSALVGEAVEFVVKTDLVSASCEWTWGDGTTSITEGTTSHAFASAGDFPVQAIVTDLITGGAFTNDLVATMRIRDRVVYVDANSKEPVWPYGDPAHAATNIYDAVDAAVDGCAVSLAAGIHCVTSQVVVSKAIAVFGATGRPDDVVLQMTGKNSRVANMNNADALLANVVIADGDLENHYQAETMNGGGVYFDSKGGTVSNCVFRNCNVASWGGVGGAVYMAGGLLTHCVLSNCVQTKERATEFGSVAYLCGSAVMRDCLVTDNVCTSNKPCANLVGTVYVSGSAKLVNSTITRNRSFACSGVYASETAVDANAEVVNCIISGNTTEGDPQLATWTGSAEKFRRCLGETAINDSCSVEPASETFNGRYKLRKASKAVDTGLLGYDDSTLDIRGRPRLVGDAIDLGCAEFQAQGLMLLVR